MLGKISKPVLVFFIFFLGILSFYIIQKPYSICDFQVQQFKQNNSGPLFPSKVKGSSPTPLILKQLEFCKKSWSAGGCYEFFFSMKKMLLDLQYIPSQCSDQLSELQVVQKYMREAVTLLALLAWGDYPPPSLKEKWGWLDVFELNLFCLMKDEYIRFWGEEHWEQLRLSVNALFPGEAAQVEGGKCINCSYRKTADKILTYGQIWEKSIFSISCKKYK